MKFFPYVMVATLVGVPLSETAALGHSMIQRQMSASDSNSALTMESKEASQEQSISDRFFSAAFDAMEAELTKLQRLAKPIKFPEPPKMEFKPMNSGASQLAISKAMLEGLYESGKERIKDLNAKEKKSIAFFADKDKTNAGRVAKLEETYKSGKLKKEFYDEETKENKRMFSYWQRVRERQHKQYISALKIQHGTMKKTSQLLDLYKKAMSGNPADQAVAKKALGKMMGGLSLLEKSAQTATCCEDELKELKTERSKFQM
eukprot:TRINITY_DN640_c0_g1_i1.p1 TRINITY_DN640_c0_g1~~TRINITY_DN640_c0_g1_i1.p1  ORF type:complete len:261 (+),score=79.48 TRINITY_DN640_c0_g1_i1:100-882(+)